jgi:hypothetical protein
MQTLEIKTNRQSDIHFPPSCLDASHLPVTVIDLQRFFTAQKRPEAVSAAMEKAANDI